MERELYRWLQSLDLSYSVKNVRRDFSNGFLVAEIFSRYYPQDVTLHSYDNASKLAAKNNNWEQLYKFFRRKNIPLNKSDFEPVIYSAPGAAIMLLNKIYNFLTKRAADRFQAEDIIGKTLQDPLLLATANLRGAPVTDEQPLYAKPTASTLLRDAEINRIEDKEKMTARAEQVLQAHNENLSYERSNERMLQSMRPRIQQLAVAAARAPSSKAISPEPDITNVEIKEVEVASIAQGGTIAQLRAQKDLQQQTIKSRSSQRGRESALGNIESMAQAAPVPQAITVKPVQSILSALMRPALREHPDVQKALDPRRDAFSSFMEICASAFPENVCVGVFDTVASRASLLTDSLIKSPTEFWKAWTLIYPALWEFSGSSPVFESIVYLLKRIAECIRNADPLLTQQYLMDVILPQVAPILAASPGRREALCEVLYAYAQETPAAHLALLRGLKDKLASVASYILCLSFFVPLDETHMDDHLLDLALYYALIGLSQPQPSLRVAGLSILNGLANMMGDQYAAILNLLPTLMDLGSDEWWEVEAQLMVLTSTLLLKLSTNHPEVTQHLAHKSIAPPPMPTRSEQRRASTTPPLALAAPLDVVLGEGEGEDEIEAKENAMMIEYAEQLLMLVARTFQLSKSKNVLQIGLCCLCRNLDAFPSLADIYITVLLAHPAPMRQRLLMPRGEGAETQAPRLAYVMGAASRLYEEPYLPALWPSLKVAKAFCSQLEARSLTHFELEHLEVLIATLPEDDFAASSEVISDWLDLFDRLKAYIFVALIEEDFHDHAAQIIAKFWLSGVEELRTPVLDASRKTLLQTLRILYSEGIERSKVAESVLVEFLQDIHSEGPPVSELIDDVLQMYKKSDPDGFASTNLVHFI
ncbi:unnamed protein product [Vitrella brassicaformis CCMP3155]|uniref:Spermatogenesis-associated protein 4 n=2 Tax=Vitrella brassicaformis TaxID=1169539 RepID=A0A0G4ELN6_VITBC|nr:unnamed protein product [Vitrella brassicaformis CCMP3155]|eukprot:CEL97882.1 unnamed protein product [Vitrella brassicaformis CCMP3155]